MAFQRIINNPRDERAEVLRPSEEGVRALAASEEELRDWVRD